MLELRPNCECCDQDLPPDRQRRTFVRSNAPFALIALLSGLMVIAPTVVASWCDAQYVQRQPSYDIPHPAYAAINNRQAYVLFR